MEYKDAIRVIQVVKDTWARSRMKFISDNVEFCEDHAPLPERLGKSKYVAYPLLRYKDTKEVVAYMNEHGYQMDVNGGSISHVFDMFGVVERPEGN